jgi:hypothetical protein
MSVKIALESDEGTQWLESAKRSAVYDVVTGAVDVQIDVTS